MKDFKKVGIRAAREAGKIILKNYEKIGSTKKKGKQDLVTNVDFECERAIIKIVSSNFPSHDILSEEAGENEKVSDYRWVIDPLDGTLNYANGVPFCSVSIALFFKEDIILGVVFDPFRDELFVAEKGKGAFMDGKRISVSKKGSLIDCLVCFDGLREKYMDVTLRSLRGLVPNVRKVRFMGSAALQLAYTACGRFDCYFAHHLNLWDCSAGVLLIREAGGVVSDVEGDEWGDGSSVAASNKRVHKEFLKWLT